MDDEIEADRIASAIFAAAACRAKGDVSVEAFLAYQAEYITALLEQRERDMPVIEIMKFGSDDA